MVGALWGRYRPVVFSKIAPGTQRAYTYAWRRRVQPWFADRVITAITTLDVEEAFANWTGAESTRADALSVLSALCRVAVKGGYIASNPCIGGDRRRQQASDVAARALTRDEFRRLLEVLPASGPYRRFVLAMVYTGCRLGEVAGLRLSDVNWDERTLSVVRTVSRPHRTSRRRAHQGSQDADCARRRSVRSNPAGSGSGQKHPRLSLHGTARRLHQFEESQPCARLAPEACTRQGVRAG